MSRGTQGKILVMGGTGTIGRHLMQELLPDREQLSIVAAARSDKSAQQLRQLGYRTVVLDLYRPETLVPAMEGVATLFMLKPYSIDYLIQSKRVIDAARKAGVKHLVNLSSYGADDTPWASIGWNRLVEAYVQVSGLRYTHLRPNFFMDNVPKRTDHAQARISHYFGDTAVSWIAAEDIARVAAAVLRDPATYHGRALPLAAEARSMDEIAAIASRISGRKYTAVYVPPAEALGQLLKVGWQEAFARPFVDYMNAISDGRVAEVGDTSRTVEEVTGRPSMSWERFIEKHRGSFA
jgi:uncharacterized protein YbjT (DUF2867 family)